jgi:hypothetical protein
MSNKEDEQPKPDRPVRPNPSEPDALPPLPPKKPKPMRWVGCAIIPTWTFPPLFGPALPS